MAAILFPILTIFINANYLESGNYMILGIALGVLVVFNHRTNLKRILDGNENKISFKKTKEEVQIKNSDSIIEKKEEKDAKSEVSEKQENPEQESAKQEDLKLENSNQEDINQENESQKD